MAFNDIADGGGGDGFDVLLIAEGIEEYLDFIFAEAGMLVS